MVSIVFGDLRAAAERLLHAERPDHTLQPTELVHEAYLRLIDQSRCDWQNRAHFLALASQAMRRILIDHARRRLSVKRGEGQAKLSLDEALDMGVPGVETTLLALDLALEKLTGLYPEMGRVVEMRFFGGLNQDECACVLGVSLRTVQRHWEFAQAWLYRELSTDAESA
jgi:RNA polymerase sigma factor (TIGR02999 family)